jgi:hypothetical protein
MVLTGKTLESWREVQSCGSLGGQVFILGSTATNIQVLHQSHDLVSLFIIDNDLACVP